MLTIVRESRSAIASIYIPARVADDEFNLRQYLENLAQGYNVPALCFWMKLSGGRLKAFFWSQHGMEARTYSPEEVTDALFHKKAFFFHPAESILNQLEEPMLAAA
jgi:hypothetical protein